MARKRNVRSWIGMAVFVLIVVEIGIGLSGGRRMRDPFQVIPEIIALKDDIRLDDTSFPFRQESQVLTPGVTLPDGGLYNITLRWSDFRGVLFDWWFIAATAAVIMVIGRPIGRLLKALKPSKRVI